MRIAVVGGGGFRVPLIFDALAGFEPEAFTLYDSSPERTSVIAAVLDDPRVTIASSLPAAVDGADVIVSAVRVGGVDGRVHDERHALELGVLGQETVGAGGLAYALRSLPVVLEQAEVIARYAPDAWTLTMTNPAGIVTEQLQPVLGRRVLGVCDSPTAMVSRVRGALGLPNAASGKVGTIDAGVDYLGINHLGWLRSYVVDGVDRLPALLDSPALDDIEEGPLFGADLLRALGAVPNEYNYWYYSAREALAGVIAAGRTRAEHVRDRQLPFYEAAAREPHRARELWQAANDERNRSYFAELRVGERAEGDVAAGGYETIAAAAIGALTGRTPPVRTILDVPAGDAVPGLTTELADMVVEVPCVVDTSGATPQPVAAPTPHQLGLMALVRGCERDIALAARTGSREAALRAFALHPLVGSAAVAAELIAGTAAG